MKSTNWLGNVIKPFFLTHRDIYSHIKIIIVFSENLMGLGDLYGFSSFSKLDVHSVLHTVFPAAAGIMCLICLFHN